MKKKINRLLFMLLLSTSTGLFSQIDTVFWFAAPWVTVDHSDNVPIVFRFSSFSNATTVRVRQPASSFDTTFVIPPNSLVTEKLSHLVSSIENFTPDLVQNKGIKISSDYPITAIYEIVTSGYNPETYSLKGQNGMGYEFVCPFQTKSNTAYFVSPNVPKSQIDVVATQNGTTVWITPRCAVEGHAAGITYSISMNAGQSYNIQNATALEKVAGSNLSGTIVFADKPISVSVSDDSVLGEAGCYDYMGDQIVPVEVVGKEYILNKGGLFNPGEFEGLYAVATENFTKITIDDGSGVTTKILNKGDTYYYGILQPLTHVIATKPVYVIHATGFGCELGEAIIPPLNCAGSDQVSFTRTDNQTFILNVLCKTTSTGDFRLNGSSALVPSSGFTVVPGTGGIWSGFQREYTTAEIPVGITSLLTNTNASDPLFSLGVINGGPYSGCLYHYMSSFLRRVYTTVGNDINICTTTSTIALTGTITGGSTTGIWTTATGTGTFASVSGLNTTYTLSALDKTLPKITFVLSSTGNCVPVTDTLVLNISKSPVVNAGPSAVICKNNITPVPLNGTLSYAAGATWSSSGDGSFGSIGALVTTYLPGPSDVAAGSATITLTSSGSFFGCPNTFDTLKITLTNPPVVVIDPDAFVCANNATIALNGTVSVGSTTGIWSSSGSGLFTPSTTTLNPIYQLSPSDIASGKVIIKLNSTLNGNCLSVFDSLIITVTPIPNVNAGLNDTICSSDIFYTVNGSVTAGATSGIWSTLGDGTFSSPSSLSNVYTIGATDILLGRVKLVLKSTGGFCIPVTDTMLIVIANSPLVNAGVDNLFCDNEPVALTGTVVGLTNRGAWRTFGTGTFNPDDSLLVTSYNPSPLDISNGFVKLLLTSIYNKGCSAVSDTVKIIFKSSPDASFISSNECANKPAVLTDNSTTPSGSITSWWWNLGDGTFETTNVVSHKYSIPGTYTISHVAYSSNGCKDTIKKSIEIYFLPDAIFYHNTACVTNSTQFIDSTKTLSGSIVSWNWNFGDQQTSGVQNPRHPFAIAGDYTVSLVVTSSFGCKDTVKQVVKVIPSPTADFDVNPNPVEALEIANFIDKSKGPASLTNWYWYFGDSTATNLQNPTHSYNTPGTFTIVLAVKDINGCIDTVRKEVFVVLLPDVPTAFSPNNDGQNDLFLVRGGPFKSINVRIYSNWGQLIFETNDQLEGWNGTFNGTEQPIGVYVWVVEVEMYNGRKIKKTGDVTILR